jgi:AcrR family transcriptional regulator
VSATQVTDRRQQIIEAGLAILREEGLRGFTQPRIAARLGLRQSNLTYYFPTISDLLTAVANAAVDVQLAAASDVVTKATTRARASEGIAAVATRHEVTRVLMSLAQAADQEEEVRVLFNALTGGLTAEISTLLTKLGLTAQPANVDLFHALVVGLSVIELATGRKNGKSRSRDVIDLALHLFAQENDTPSTAATPSKRALTSDGSPKKSRSKGMY